MKLSLKYKQEHFFKRIIRLRIMGYNRIFTKIMYNAKNPMEGSIDIFIDIL